MIRWLAPWLNGVAALELALVFCAFYIVITLLGIVLVHPHMRRMVHGKRQVNDIVISVAANFGLVYAVLLGLLIVATFQNTKDLQDHIATEASRLSTIYRGAESYPEPLRSELRSQLRDYAHYDSKGLARASQGTCPRWRRSSIASDSGRVVLV